MNQRYEPQEWKEKQKKDTKDKTLRDSFSFPNHWPPGNQDEDVKEKAGNEEKVCPTFWKYTDSKSRFMLAKFCLS